MKENVSTMLHVGEKFSLRIIKKQIAQIIIKPNIVCSGPSNKASMFRKKISIKVNVFSVPPSAGDSDAEDLYVAWFIAALKTFLSLPNW